MKTTKTIKDVISEYRNDVHNSYSPKHHVPHYVPGYKGMYHNQLRNNKILFGFCIVATLFGMLCVAGSIARNKVLQRENEDLRVQLQTGLKMAVSYADLTDRLETELASCSATAKLQKLSPKARSHVKQQPAVAQKIKNVFGDAWIEATELISRESSLNPEAINPTSGACGLGQALPCSKMNCSLTDVDCQLAWVKKYITNRYGTTLAALYSHDMKGWY